MKGFIQFQLWRDCNHKCPFCNAGVVSSSEEYKLKQLDFVKNELESGKYKDITRVGVIGGEFFDGQLSTERLITKFIDTICYLTEKPEIEQVLVASALLYKDSTTIDRVLGSIPNKDKIMVCTSWDSKYRFSPSQPESLWEQNVKHIYDAKLANSVHVQTILTSHFINLVLNNKFNIYDFEHKYHVRMDFNAPTISALESDKYNMGTKLKDFFPKREDFLKFLSKVYKEGQADKDRFCNYDNMSDFLWYTIDTNYILLEGWHGPVDGITINIQSPLPSMHEEKSDYIDSHIRMRKDVIDMWENIYE